MSRKSFIAELRAKPEKRETLIALQTELRTLTFDQEPDVLVYELFQSDTDKDLFQIVATFKDAAAFDHHMEIDFHNRLVPPIMECLARDMKLEFYRSIR